MMATPGTEVVSKSEGWHQDELSGMVALLQRAEQRMRNLDPASKHTVKATYSDKYATAAHPLILRF